MLRYIQNGKNWSPRDVIDGFRHSPDIATKWSDEELKAIGLERYSSPPAPASPVDPLTIPLSRRQLRKGLLALGVYSSDIVDAINGISDKGERELVLLNWEDAESGLYHFGDPLVSLIMKKSGIGATAAKARWAELVEAD